MSQPPWFEYAACPQRSAWQWPGGANLTAWIVVNIEHFEFGKLGTAIQPHLTSQPEIANYAWRDYGNRVGIWRLFDLFDRYPRLKVTAALNADICRYYPAILTALLERGWEIMAHGLNNSTGQAGLDEEAERALITQTLDTIQVATGQRPAGWLTPGFSVTPRTFDLLQAAGLTYTADWVNDDQPYRFQTAGGPLVAVPYTLEANDITLCLSNRYSGPEFQQAVLDQFEQLYTESRTDQKARIFSLGLHPFIVGQPLRLPYLAAIVEQIARRVEEGTVWSATGQEISQYYQGLGL